jgi:NADPH:quinone reductase-like Zn-dependent oxidoreductase
VVAARDSVVVPEHLDPELVEALTVNGVTAWQMLHRAAKVTRGQTILVFGASGGVGTVLSQLALHAGVRVIGAASPRHHDALRAAGVEPVDHADPDLAARVRELAPRGLDAVFDNIGGQVTRTAFDLLARGGTLVSYAIIEAASGTGGLALPFLGAVARNLLWSALPNGKRATFYDLWAGHTLRKSRFRRHLEADLTAVLDLLDRGVLQPVIAARYPLAEVAAALVLAESRTVSGKIVLLP